MIRSGPWRGGPRPRPRFRPALWDNAAVSSGDTAQTAIGPPAHPYPELEPPVGEECGVFGVWAPGEEVSRLTYFGLYALQHRGQEAAGIATTDGSNILVYKDLGLVSQVFDDPSLSNLTGHIAVGHVRYATTGATTWENSQPMLGPVAGSTLALAHNGNLTNTRELMAAVHSASGEDLTGELGRGSSTDTAVIAALFGLLFAWLVFRLYVRVRPRFIPDTPLLPYPAVVPRTILCGMLLTHAAITLIAAWWVW